MVHTPNPNVKLEDILVMGAKGSLEDVKREASLFANNSLSFDAKTVEFVEKTLKSCLPLQEESPISFEDVVDLFLEKSSSSGQPWQELDGSKQNMLDRHSRDKIVETLYEYERRIISGEEFPATVWSCISKEDKYKFAKLSSGRLRTIQAGDMFYLCLLIRWVAPAVKAIYDNHPRFLIKFTPEDYLQKVSLAFQNYETFGVDVTGLDRCVPAESIIFTVNFLCSYTNAPDNVETFLSTVACEGPLQFPDGTWSSARIGGNPSGIYITTLINCIFMDLVMVESCLRLGVLDKVGEGVIKWSITGDDILCGLGGQTEGKEVCLALVSELQNFNLEVKVDLMSGGELYPPQLACHAPYLGRVSVQAGDCILAVPTEPRRNLGWYHSYPSRRTLGEKLNSWVGIRESVLPYVVASTFDPTLPVPGTVLDFLADFDSTVSKHRLLPEVQALNPVTIEQCALFCGVVSVRG